MKQAIFDVLTWTVAVGAVLSSLWLASRLPVADLRASKALEHQIAQMPLPTEPMAAGQAALAASDVKGGQ